MVVAEFIKMAEGEKIEREYHIAKRGVIFPVNAFLAVTNKRIAIFTTGESLAKHLSLNETRIDKVSDIDFHIKPMNIVGVILGALLMMFGLVLLLLEIAGIAQAGGNLFMIGFVMLFVGIIMIGVSMRRRFMLIINVTSLYSGKPEIIIGDPVSLRKPPFSIGYGVVMGYPGMDAVKCAQELGALVLDLQRKGESRIAGGSTAATVSAVSSTLPPPPPF